MCSRRLLSRCPSMSPLKADYVSPDSLEVVKERDSRSPLVDEVVYQQSLVDKLNTNLGKISLVLGIFVVLLLFISFVLINDTVRLNVFSKRFTIHTMKLVGATKSFIRGPSSAIRIPGAVLSPACHPDAPRGLVHRPEGVLAAFRGVQPRLACWS